MDIIKVKANSVEDMIKEVESDHPELSSCCRYTIRTKDGEDFVLFTIEPLTNIEFQELSKFTSKELQFLMENKEFIMNIVD